MPYITKKFIVTNGPTPKSLKHWITELTNYTPHQVDTVISQIEYRKIPQSPQKNLTV